MYPENTFLRVQLQLGSAHVHEGLSYIINLYCFLLARYDDVIDIGEDISVHLLFEDGLHHSVESGSSILNALEHSEVTVSVEGCNKACFTFVFLSEPNLMITRKIV
jgi:hypothetical protein